MLLILTSAITNRLRYIADLMLRDMLGLGVAFTTSMDEFQSHPGPKLAYAAGSEPDAPRVAPSPLLFEDGIKVQEAFPFMVDSLPLIFKSEDQLSALPFDPFAAGFYMASRYEEYLPFIKDKYGRFPADGSVAWQGKFLDIPIVHLWADMVKKLLERHYPGIQFNPQRYRFVPTIDVDHAWCYRGRPLLRSLGGAGRAFMSGRFSDISKRIRVLAGLAADPFDTFEYILKVLEPSGVHPLFFILFADYGGDDNNVNIRSKAFRQLVRELDQHQGVGVHPSLSSNKHYLKLQAECSGLGSVLDRQVTRSRQHFLKFSVPRTYRALHQVGITEDYTMGYASHPGFRAGVAIPYPFFDISRNLATSLLIHPITIMDVTMKDYLRLNPEQSLEMIGNLVSAVKSVNGEFVSLWHNESLCETGRWQGWRRVFEEMVIMAST